MTPEAIRRSLMLVVFTAASASCVAQASTAVPVVKRETLERLAPPDDTSLLDALWSDAAARVDLRGSAAAAQLNARLAEITRELKLWETVLTYAKQGRIIELVDLRPSRLIDSADVDAERAKTEEVRRKLDLRLAQIAAAKAAAPPPSQPSSPTAHGRALLDTVFDAPPVENARPASRPKTAPSLDPAGLARALYEAGDWLGTLEAVGEVPTKDLTPELRYRRARSLDKLRRSAEAKEAYQDVVVADPAGFYGRQAKWMLELSAKQSSPPAPATPPKAAKKEDGR